MEILDGALRRAVAMALLASSCSAGMVFSETGTPSPSAATEYRVKAAFLFNFAKFVEWPDERHDAESVTIGVLGIDPFGEDLDLVVRHKVVGSKTIKIRRFPNLEQLEPCDILFISSSEASRLDQVLDALDGTATLTVGENEDFARRGGIIRFFTQRNKIRFEINLDAADYEELRLSSKLLQVARTVRGKRGGGGN